MGIAQHPAQLPCAPITPTVVLCFPVVHLPLVYTEVAGLHITCLLLVCIFSKPREKPDIACDIWALGVTLSSPSVIAGLCMALADLKASSETDFSLILASLLLFIFLPRQRKIQGLGISGKQGGIPSMLRAARQKDTGLRIAKQPPCVLST